MAGHCAVYQFFQDQGGSIGGVLAFIAGVLVYYVGRRQAKAVEDQNHQLRREKRRELARNSLIAGRLLDGILESVAVNIQHIGPFSTDPGSMILENETNQIRQALKPPPLYQIMQYLGQCNTQAIEDYYLLCDRIENFRVRTASTAGNVLRTELDSIQAVLRHCREEIAGDMARASAVLRDTQEG